MSEPWDEPDGNDDPYEDLSLSEFYEEQHEREARTAYELSGGETEDPDLTWPPKCLCCGQRITDHDKEGPMCLPCDIAGCDETQPCRRATT